MKTLGNTCARVVGNARMRHITDATIVAELAVYGRCWRRDYMERFAGSNPNYLFSAIPKIVSQSGLRNNSTYGKAIQLLDQAVLDFKEEADKRFNALKRRLQRRIHDTGNRVMQSVFESWRARLLLNLTKRRRLKKELRDRENVVRLRLPKSGLQHCPRMQQHRALQCSVGNRSRWIYS